ncbi:Ras-related protein Rab-18 [Strongyloides ratti]|uniref:Ras-related protein Rab-18 n=1 Tax=Strongyloides ratti TaxID=34506 RepID=A0A090LEX6_STRRB|nr:Ras-related protein Rab-18 [Strongyloides ratti]CEF68307.1 Ras-related protein Rab-18 [Strongyloides ratti]
MTTNTPRKDSPTNKTAFKFWNSKQGKPEIQLNRSKICILGDSGVGKSSLILRYNGQGFTTKVTNNLGVPFIKSYINILNEKCELLILDPLICKNREEAIINYINFITNIIFVFDLTNRESFKNLNKWYHLVEKRVTTTPRLFVIATKNDDILNRCVTEGEGLEWAKNHEAEYFEVSSYTGSGVIKSINSIAHTIFTNEIESLKSASLSTSLKSQNSDEVGSSYEPLNKKISIKKRETKKKRSLLCCTIS